jgi:hypothetical protein
MKKFFQVFSVFIVLSSIVFSQTVVDSIIVSDGVAGSQVLKFGLDPLATNGIDVIFGESLLPPFPPAGAFEARLFLPENSFSGTASSRKDFRFMDSIPYSGTKEFRLAYQPGTGSTQMTFTWNFPPDISGLLQDLFGGIVVNVNMSGSGSYPLTLLTIDKMKMFITYNNVVPVELVSFSASLIGSTVNLNWATATELNNSGFEIQRKSANSNWEKIGFVEGNGTTSEKHTYSFSDNYSGQGTVSYRLKQIDFDGSISYSNVVNVKFNLPSDFKLNQNYPNPFNPSTAISFSIPKATNVSLTIFNQIGEKVDELVNKNLEAGSYNYTWNASEQSSGIYFYELKTNDFRSVRKMTLIK